jgi:L-threonylcarbamoyladenylate synthase
MDGAIAEPELNPFAHAGLERSTPSLPASSAPLSPGMKYRHYSPRALFALADSALISQADTISALSAWCANNDKIGSLILRNNKTWNAAALSALPNLHIEFFSDSALSTVAREMFSLVRRLDDDLGVDFIVMESTPASDEGLAIMNRAEKAAACRPAFATLDALLDCIVAAAAKPR